MLACLVMAVAAAAIARSAGMFAAVVGGGLLIGVSFLSISSSVDAIVRHRGYGLALLKIAGRYALLAFLAYVMIARLRLSPLGLIAGASSVAVAAAFETVGIFKQKTALRKKIEQDRN